MFCSSRMFRFFYQDSEKIIAMNKKHILKNNIVLITEKIESSKTCSIGFWFAAGSRFEDKDNRGISHFTEHLLFKGTKNYSTRQIAIAFDRMGGYINAFTERENVCMYAAFPALGDNFKVACDILCEMSCNCIFPKRDYLREKSVVQSEIASISDDSEECALDELASRVWNDEHLSQTISGTIKDVESLSLEKIKSWYEKYFAGGELTVIACGNFDEEFLCRKLESLGEHRKPVEYGKESHFNEVSWKKGANFVKSDFSQSQIFVVFPFKNQLSEKENYAVSVFNALTGDTMSSRLFDVLREKNGLCYNVYSYFTVYENAGAWCAYISCEKHNAAKTAGFLLKEINRILKCDFLEEEIECAKEHLCGEEIMTSSDMEYAMKRNQKNNSMGLSLCSFNETIDHIRKVSKDDIINLVKRVFNKEEMSLLVYGPKLSKKDKKEILCNLL